MTKKIWTKLFTDETGAVVSPELMVVGTVGVLGAVTGLAIASQAVNDEMVDLAQAFRGFDQSFSVGGTTVGRGGAASSGASFNASKRPSGFTQQSSPAADIARVQMSYQIAQGQAANVAGQTSLAITEEEVVLNSAVVSAEQTGRRINGQEALNADSY